MKTHLQDQALDKQFAKPGQIVVASNLTDLDFLLPHAIAQAKAYGADLTLAHAITVSGSKVPFGIEYPGQFEMDAQQLDMAVRKVRAEGVNCTRQIAYAFLPDDFVHDVVGRTGAQRVIVASRGRGSLGRIALGSVAHQLLSTLKIPAFVVGPKSLSRSQHFYPKRILHPVSLSGAYSESVEFAYDITEFHGAELMLMHVFDPDLPEEVNPARSVKWARNTLEAAIPDRTTVAVPLSMQVVSGNILDEVLRTAVKFNADWIVFGTTPSFYAPIFVSSAAYQAMVAIDIPVLTFPHRVKSTAMEFEKIEMPVKVGHFQPDPL